MLNSIEAVIESLDTITEQAISEHSPEGYFSSLYGRVTKEVRDAIHRREFEDNERMEALDVVFANRYLDAYRIVKESGNSTRSWKVAFEQNANSKLIVLQHLLLGMNAHINLDLGIAAAQVTDAASALSLKNDFYKINQILGSMIQDTQKKLTYIFGPLGIVDQLLGSLDERLSLFSITYARDKAWNQTLELLLADPNQKTALIQERDEKVSAFATYLVRPPKASIRCLLWLIRCLERKDIATRIRLLNE
jgi:hypothetical protein